MDNKVSVDGVEMTLNDYDVILADGTKIPATLNGTTFFTATKVSKELFFGNLNIIRVVSRETGEERIFENAECVNLKEFKGEEVYSFAFRELSKTELDILKLQTDVAFISMMNEIPLDGGELDEQ